MKESFNEQLWHPPTLWSEGDGTLACGRGVGESQFRRGDILYTVVLYIYIYIVVKSDEDKRRQPISTIKVRVKKSFTQCNAQLYN
jgi:hypothetical protein